MKLNEFLDKLQGVTGGGNQYQAKCPGHEDSTASLSISTSQKGDIIIKCHAGCSAQQVVESIGLKMTDLFSEPLQQKNKQTHSTSDWRVYNYQNEDGQTVYRVKRTPGGPGKKKGFYQDHLKDDKFIKGMQGVKRLPYNLPAILKAEPEQQIYIVEGEKDANNLIKLGLIATTNVGGAGKWRDDYSSYLQGHTCCILPDNDEPGQKHAQQVAESLHKTGIVCRILCLPDLPQKGDVSDWLENGGDLGQLLSLTASQPLWSPPPSQGVETCTGNYETVPLNPLRRAEFLIQKAFTVNNKTAVRRYRDDWWLFKQSHYRRLKDETLKAFIYRNFDGVRTPAGIPIIPDRKMVSEIMSALPACKGVIMFDELEAPIVPGNNSEQLIAFLNGILDLETGKLIKHGPENFTINSLPYNYDCNAEKPVEWEKFLLSVFGDDIDSQLILQQWFGYCLLNDTSKQKILLLIGPRRSGKGTIAKVLELMMGDENVASPTLTSLYTQFGLTSLMGRKLAIIPDARLSGRSDQAVITERLLSISGEDKLTIDRKNKDALASVKLNCKIMILTNELPHLNDSSGALSSRFLPINMKKSFYGQEDFGLFAKLKNEMPGILQWAIDGIRLLDNGFTTSEASEEVKYEFAKLTSPVQAFAEECCMFPDPTEYFTVNKDDLYKAYLKWAESEGYQRHKTKNVFMRDLRAAYPSLTNSRVNSDGTRKQLVIGVKLRPSMHSSLFN